MCYNILLDISNLDKIYNHVIKKIAYKNINKFNERYFFITNILVQYDINLDIINEKQILDVIEKYLYGNKYWNNYNDIKDYIVSIYKSYIETKQREQIIIPLLKSRYIYPYHNNKLYQKYIKYGFDSVKSIDSRIKDINNIVDIIEEEIYLSFTNYQNILTQLIKKYNNYIVRKNQIYSINNVKNIKQIEIEAKIYILEGLINNNKDDIPLIMYQLLE